jgi:hypothetical protein
MVVRVVDIETTGTDPVADAVIEIASVDLLAEGTITNRAPRKIALVRAAQIRFECSQMIDGGCRGSAGVLRSRQAS